ncbi:P-loop containing nucleoside triphosphate hydrolase protein [Talaromyces proteolyticus]|uniref:P-loop containing nucleoside triphosphate hydrolase protein n=1 Tax=Talaromyces proteolyticus TaxID=1131652 RepID=A0AAD4L034_9EURO|nr:P-loop containing nucleoside triphosphate hydrolase protein [Talaromyces proteolyticus]KAH8700439.1 P-loop containing nucleoside triphosphate hydrolase protein [Talaromyces proteolyticus]
MRPINPTIYISRIYIPSPERSSNDNIERVNTLKFSVHKIATVVFVSLFITTPLRLFQTSSTNMNDFADLSTWGDWDLLTGIVNETPVQTPGMKLELKCYDIRENSKGDRVPLQTGRKISYAAEPEEANDSAMVVTKTYYKDHTLKQTELVIQSPYIIEAIESTVPKKYPGTNITNKKITIFGNPECLFHYRKELVAYGRQLQDRTAAEHVAFTLNYMGKALADDIAHYKNCAAKRDQPPGLDFDRLWMEYRPGDLIYVKGRRESWVGRLISMKHSGFLITNWWLTLERITLIEELLYVSEIVVVSSYNGFKYFKDLNAFPLRFHPDRKSIERKMIQRGKAFHALRGVHQRFYSGIARWASDRKTDRDYDDDCHFENFQVKSRVIIDNQSYIEARPDHTDQDCYETSRIVEELADLVSDEHLMICHHEVFGFSLTDKRWCAFNLDNLHEISFDAEAFDNLILPDEQKGTLLALAKTYTDTKFEYDDFITGKGRGLIILLHGDPGLGKTLTAESTADYIQRPLYPIRSGDLGIEASALEKSLADSFAQAAKWNAIILLDEADVFLEARQRNELQRNSLVSIFLRTLEYYQGFMFLTTNRIDSFDPAFKSRIHLTIKYHALSTESRRILWHSFITNGSMEYDQSCLNEKVLNELAATYLNGRQIRNMVRTSYAIAASTGSILTAQHLRRTLRAMAEFELDLNENSPPSESRELDMQSGSNKRRRLD